MLDREAGVPDTGFLAGAPVRSGHQASSDRYRVEQIGGAEFATLADDVADLTRRAAMPNVFMDPAVVAALSHVSGSPLTVLLVWCRPAGHSARRLVGAWALAPRRPIPWLPVRALIAPLHPLCYLGTPVIDRSCASEVFQSLFEHLAASGREPGSLMVGDLSDEGGLLEALGVALDRCGLRHVTLRAWKRAKLQSTLPGPDYLASVHSRATLKKLRKKRARLARSGAVALTVHRTPGEVVGAFEEFLVLEGAGWKGHARNGRAIVRDPSWSVFARAMVQGLAGRGQVQIDVLRVGGRPAAILVMLQSGRAAFAWRIAYDPAFNQCSPGLLLLEDRTRALLADRSIAFTDSCNVGDSGYMADLWTERLALQDVVIALTSSAWPSFWLLVVAETLRRTVRSQARMGLRAALHLAGRLGMRREAAR